MPDLVTHTLVPYLGLRLLRKRDVTFFVLFGAMLPDLLSRSFNYLFVNTWIFVGDFTRPLHSPLVTIAACLLISFFFEERIRKKAFTWISIGSGTHLLFDYMQTHLGSGYLLLFPFSRHEFRWGLFWPEDSLFMGFA